MTDDPDELRMEQETRCGFLMLYRGLTGDLAPRLRDERSASRSIANPSADQRRLRRRPITMPTAATTPIDFQGFSCT